MKQKTTIVDDNEGLLLRERLTLPVSLKRCSKRAVGHKWAGNTCLIASP